MDSHPKAKEINKPKKVLTLLLLVQSRVEDPSQGRILLGMKKRGFGEGKWNGFGGKVNLIDGRYQETIEEAAMRELEVSYPDVIKLSVYYLL